MNSGRLRGIVILLIALVLAGVAAYVVSGVIDDARRNVAEVRRPTEKTEVVVAARSVPPGWTIRGDDLRKRELIVDYVPDDVYRTPEEVVGRVASDRILAGEYIREERLAAPEAGVGLPAIIPRGMRALQVPVKGSAAVSGFINPGNFTDVIAVCPRAEPPEVRTLLQAVPVLAVNDRMVAATFESEESRSRAASKSAGVGSSVTLALSPADAELVKHAYGTCDITLTLRNDIDVTKIESNERPAAEAGASSPPTEG